MTTELSDFVPRQPAWFEEIAKLTMVPRDKRSVYVWTNFKDFRDRTTLYSFLSDNMNCELAMMGYSATPSPISGQAFLYAYAEEAVDISKLEALGFKIERKL